MTMLECLAPDWIGSFGVQFPVSLMGETTSVLKLNGCDC